MSVFSLFYYMKHLNPEYKMAIVKYYFHYAYEVNRNVPFTKNKSTKTRKRKNYKSQ